MAASLNISATTNTYSITITNAIDGITYTAYRIFDATYNETSKATAYTITKSDTTAPLISLLQAAEADAKKEEAMPAISLVADGQNKYEVHINNSKAAAELLQSLIVTQSSDTEGKTTYSKLENLSSYPSTSATATSANSLTLNPGAAGYYYIDSNLDTSSGMAVTLTSNMPSASVQLKTNVTPSTPSTNGAKTADKTTANRGDTINYTIAFTALNQVVQNGTTQSVASYTITDTSQGLDISENTALTITVGDKTLSTSDYTKAVTTQTENNTAKTVMKITIPWVDSDNAFLYGSKEDVKISYAAIVKTDENIPNALNKAIISYNLTSSSPETINPDEEDVAVKTYALKIKKYDASDTSTMLSGAQFVLKDNSGNTVTLYQTQAASENQPAKYTTEKPGENAAAVEYIETGATGEIIIYGLKDLSASSVDYSLEERKAPSGYNKMSAPMDIIVGEYSENEETKTTDPVIDINVPNEKGATLPSTGGTGTAIFYALGAGLVLLAIIYFVSKSKMHME
jgi:LPXTG-motif cell wall-anchored protein